MAMHPDPTFPLLVSDQAEVIQIFLELISAEHPSECATEVSTNQQTGQLNDRIEPGVPGETSDLE